MHEITTAILLMTLLGVFAQDLTLEERAVVRVQQTPVSRYDPALPSQSFGNWLNQVVGPRSGVSWRLGECVERDGMASEWEQGIPACVEATAILPDDRKVVAQILVGSFKQGLSMATRFHFAVIESDTQFQDVRRLSDLPQLLRKPFPVKRLNAVTLPQIRSTGSLRFYSAGALAIVDPPKMMAEPNAEPPPPKLASDLAASESITASVAIAKVWPTYPLIAKRWNVSGVVQVAITIDETGRVIEAKATSGHPALRSAAEEAARKWGFRPARLNGKPMKQQDVLSFVFKAPQ